MRQKMGFLIDNMYTIGYLVKDNPKTVIVEAKNTGWFVRFSGMGRFVHNFQVKRHKVKHGVKFL